MPTVLLVEDNRVQAALLRTGLEAQGFSVDVAGDGVEALALARRRPAAILSDILMPNMDGFRLCWELGRDPELRDIPVVLRTAAHGRELDRHFAQSLGAVGLVDKGMDIEALGALLREEARLGLVRQAEVDPRLDEATFARDHAVRLLDLSAWEAAVLENERGSFAGAYQDALKAMVSALDERDTGAGMHSQRVAAYASAVAEHLIARTGQGPMAGLVPAALLCDLGNIRVSESVLRKRGALAPTELEEVHRHPEFTQEILSEIGALREAAEVVLAHHERWDGSGYPKGLTGEDIPLAARIIAVADAVDAITSDRPYRDAETFERASVELRRCSGSQFDPNLVDVASGIEPEEWMAIRERAEQGTAWSMLTPGYL